MFDGNKTSPEKLLKLFGERYEVRFNENLELVTIRHYDGKTIDRVMVDKEILLEQRTRQTIRMVMKNK